MSSINLDNLFNITTVCHLMSILTNIGKTKGIIICSA